MRNKFVNFYSLKNPCFRIQQTLGKHILPPARCGNVFPAKSCWDAWRSDSWRELRWIWWMKQIRSPVRSTFEALVAWCVVGLCQGEESGPFCWPIPAAGIADFSVYLINLLSILLRCNGFAGIQKAVVDQMGSRPPNSDSDLFWGASLALGSNSELLLGPATLSGRHQLSYKIHFPSQITIQ